MSDKEKIELAVYLFLSLPGSCWCGPDGPMGDVQPFIHSPICNRVQKFILENSEKSSNAGSEVK